MVLAVVALTALAMPGVAIDLFAEAAEVVVAIIVKVELGPLAFLAVEAMGGGAQSDGGAAAFEVGDEGVGGGSAWSDSPESGAVVGVQFPVGLGC